MFKQLLNFLAPWLKKEKALSEFGEQFSRHGI
jgi:hypothetical protein